VQGSVGTQWNALTGVLSNGQVIPYGDAGISRLGSQYLAVGNGTNGSVSGKLELTTLILDGPLYDGTVSAGTPGQILSSTSSPAVKWVSGIPWSSLSNSAADLILANAGYRTEFDQTTNVSWTWINKNSGTVSSTNASPVFYLGAYYYNGSSAPDYWTIGTSLAAGTNGASTLTLGHSGSTGTAAVQVPSLIATGGLEVGAPTGGLEGTGTINAQGAYYSNGTIGVTQTAIAVGALATIGGIVTTFTGVSDERLKDFTLYEGGLDEILSISPIRYRWNDLGQKWMGLSGDRDYVGFSANNVQKSIPEAIQGFEGEEKYLSFDDRPVIAALVNAVKELAARIKELEVK
jgi:hypothetical protein